MKFTWEVKCNQIANNGTRLKEVFDRQPVDWDKDLNEVLLSENDMFDSITKINNEIEYDMNYMICETLNTMDVITEEVG